MGMVGFSPGDKVRHREFGEGVFLAIAESHFGRVFFQDLERVVPISSIEPLQNRSVEILKNSNTGEKRRMKSFLSFEANALPLSENAASLTSAQIDLLPHQVVLTHRVAINSPRRFLVADEVGLGKTIETALILRELASRGELNRALMIVPAGLVNNWHRELNEVFNLNFEIFGADGDITDRRSNAFAKHNFLIASVDTLKRATRIKNILNAPKWDLVVFDEAHHLTAYKSGGKVKKTENYKLAEALRDHCRDMILLSATPHQGDHFRFWMLIRLLDPSLFLNEEEMLEKRHRLNSVIFRRTKADACRTDGSTLFARRNVHTESFLMSDEEREFYNALSEYISDGFDLAKKQGGKGQALGFVMTIFQKIAASSFAAINRTLKRRLLGLTIFEALQHDDRLNISERDILFKEARAIIREEYSLASDKIGDIEVEKILIDLKSKILKKVDDESLQAISSEFESEIVGSAGEDSVSTAITLALPEERLRVKSLINELPKDRETKLIKLTNALQTLWNKNSNEKIVIFATYLGTVEMIATEIDKAFPGQGVVVLKGGDHTSKLAAERKFKKTDGPRVMICTAAGREGINLQFARILFNFDLPWNPMDLEQRIGRIHRYGQKDTAQVYNLVLSDTIEGKIFLLLDEKLIEIAKAVGKVDERGEVAEDLKSAVLGQLSERISYDKLYSEALQDPELKRTKLELEAALQNAKEAKDVVNDLFQELDRFNIDDYMPLSNVSSELDRIENFLKLSAFENAFEYSKVSDTEFKINLPEKGFIFTKEREQALKKEGVELLGIDHPFVEKLLQKYRDIPLSEIGIEVDGQGVKGVLTKWLVEAHGEQRDIIRSIVSIGVSGEGNRLLSLESSNENYFVRNDKVADSIFKQETFFYQKIEPLLQREISHRGLVKGNMGYSAKLLVWVCLS